MAGRPRTIRLPKALELDLEREFAHRGIKEWSSGVVDLLQEAVRMRRFPGIAFVDSPTGRRPIVSDTGLDVWEIIATWKVVGQDEEEFKRAYHWLAPAQLRIALAYYRAYPEEIDARIALDEFWTPERIREAFPFVFLDPDLPVKADT